MGLKSPFPTPAPGPHSLSSLSIPVFSLADARRPAQVAPTPADSPASPALLPRRPPHEHRYRHTHRRRHAAISPTLEERTDPGPKEREGSVGREKAMEGEAGRKD